ncbi:MAG: hypothetical protein ACRD2L_14535 [Terriglobia bacterium]
MDKKSNEFFYLNEQGERLDAAIHEPILDNPDAEGICKQQSLASLRARGFTEEELGVLFVL